MRKISCVGNRSIHVNDRSTVSLERKSSVLEAGGASTMFPLRIVENWVSKWMKSLAWESLLKWENHSHFEKSRFIIYLFIYLFLLSQKLTFILVTYLLHCHDICASIKLFKDTP
jgi:hypothetical protein